MQAILTIKNFIEHGIVSFISFYGKIIYVRTLLYGQISILVYKHCKTNNIVVKQR